MSRIISISEYGNGFEAHMKLTLDDLFFTDYKLIQGGEIAYRTNDHGDGLWVWKDTGVRTFGYGEKDNRVFEWKQIEGTCLRHVGSRTAMRRLIEGLFRF